LKDLDSNYVQEDPLQLGEGVIYSTATELAEAIMTNVSIPKIIYPAYRHALPLFIERGLDPKSACEILESVVASRFSGNSQKENGLSIYWLGGFIIYAHLSAVLNSGEAYMYSKGALHKYQRNLRITALRDIWDAVALEDPIPRLERLSQPARLAR